MQLIKAQKTSRVLSALLDEPVILELKDGNVFAGMVDDYEERIVNLYNCRQLVGDRSGWIEQTDRIVRMKDGTARPDPLPGFRTSEISAIFRAPDEWLGPRTLETLGLKSDGHRIDLEDLLTVYLDKTHIPARGIACDWDPDNKKHSPECDAKIHEALVAIYTRVAERKFHTFSRDFGTLVRELIHKGVKIPL